MTFLINLKQHPVICLQGLTRSTKVAEKNTDIRKKIWIPNNSQLFHACCNILKYNSACHVISGSLSPRHDAFSGCGWRNGLRYGG